METAWLLGSSRLRSTSGSAKVAGNGVSWGRARSRFSSVSLGNCDRGYRVGASTGEFGLSRLSIEVRPRTWRAPKVNTVITAKTARVPIEQ